MLSGFYTLTDIFIHFFLYSSEIVNCNIRVLIVEAVLYFQNKLYLILIYYISILLMFNLITFCWGFLHLISVVVGLQFSFIATCFTTFCFSIMLVCGETCSLYFPDLEKFIEHKYYFFLKFFLNYFKCSVTERGLPKQTQNDNHSPTSK